jgi:hypothetical protein
MSRYGNMALWDVGFLCDICEVHTRNVSLRIREDIVESICCEDCGNWFKIAPSVDMKVIVRLDVNKN